MKTRLVIRAFATLVVVGSTLVPVVHADFEVTAPDGRRILLRDDGTWRYVETVKAPPKVSNPRTAPDISETEKLSGDEAMLRIEGRTELGNNCRYDVRLVNTLPYEISSIAPTFAAHRANGVVYDSVLSLFQGIRPGDSQRREVLFRGIGCREITRVQVSGGDRCVMGDLLRFGQPEGACLKRVRVIDSDLVRFDK